MANAFTIKYTRPSGRVSTRTFKSEVARDNAVTRLIERGQVTGYTLRGGSRGGEKVDGLGDVAEPTIMFTFEVADAAHLLREMDRRDPLWGRLAVQYLEQTL